MSNAKLIFGLVDGVPTLSAASQISKRSVPIIAIKTDKRQSLPDESIDFQEMINTKSKSNVNYFLF